VSGGCSVNTGPYFPMQTFVMAGKRLDYLGFPCGVAVVCTRACTHRAAPLYRAGFQASEGVARDSWRWAAGARAAALVRPDVDLPRPLDRRGHPHESKT
jgi:hypothetical protein